MNTPEQVALMVEKITEAKSQVERAQALRSRISLIREIRFSSPDASNFNIKYGDDTFACQRGFELYASQLESEAQQIIDELASPKLDPNPSYNSLVQTELNKETGAA